MINDKTTILLDNPYDGLHSSTDFYIIFPASMLLALLQQIKVMNTESKYVVDFDIKLAEIIAETKYMEALGFMVPELARNVALQVSDCLHSFL